MKKYLYVSILFIAACFIESYATNYTYKSFIKEGSTKEWKTTDGTYLAQGDTVINSVHYTKLLYAKNDTDYEYFAALKEIASWNNLIVYIVFKGEAVPKILYEFNKEESEDFDCGNDAGRVTQRKMVTIRGIERVSYTVIPLWEKTTPVYTLVSMYDGIGLIKNPFDIMSDGYLLLCRENGIVLYEKGDEIKELEGIRSIKNEEIKMNNGMFDLQGRRVTHPKKGEIYIQKGKKYINKYPVSNGDVCLWKFVNSKGKKGNRVKE